MPMSPELRVDDLLVSISDTRSAGYARAMLKINSRKDTHTRLSPIASVAPVGGFLAGKGT